MPALEITITDAGRAEVINAQNTGTAPVEITEVGVGTGQYTPSPTQTALSNELKRLDAVAGLAVSDHVIHLSVNDNSADEYELYEFGLYLESGTLFAVYSQVGEPILDKAAATILLLAVDIALTADLNATSFTFGSTDFANPPASTTTQGVTRFATNTEARGKVLDTVALTPSNLAALNAALDFIGLVALSGQTENEQGLNGTKATTPVGVHQAFKQFGLGYWTPIENANDAIRSGLYSLPEYLGAGNSPVPNQSGSLLVINGGADEDYCSQVWIESNDSGNQRLFIRSYSGTSEAWSSWLEVLTRGAYGLGGHLVVSDADTATTSGLYSLPAASANGPLPGVSGTLQVITGGSTSQYVSQVWTQSNNSDMQGMYVRHKKGANVWSIWRHIGSLEQRIPLFGGGIMLLGGQQYHIVDTATYTLPDTTALTPGDSVVVSKSIYAAPTLDTFGSELIARDGSNTATVTLTADSECVFVWNGTNWEWVGGNPAAGYQQQLASTGYNVTPNGYIEQWLFLTIPGGGTSASISLPISFPTDALHAFFARLSSAVGPDDVLGYQATQTTLTIYAPTSTGGNRTFSCKVIGH